MLWPISFSKFSRASPAIFPPRRETFLFSMKPLGCSVLVIAVVETSPSMEKSNSRSDKWSRRFCLSSPLIFLCWEGVTPKAACEISAVRMAYSFWSLTPWISHCSVRSSRIAMDLILFFDPAIWVTFGFVNSSSSFLGEFWIFDFLNSFVTDFSQPAFEGFGFGGRNGLDDSEESFGIRAICFSLFSIRS